jgi:hypothetical protein
MCRIFTSLKCYDVSIGKYLLRYSAFLTKHRLKQSDTCAAHLRIDCEVPPHTGWTENGIRLKNEINRSPATRSPSQSAGISKTDGFYGSSCVVIILLKWNTTGVP